MKKKVQMEQMLAVSSVEDLSVDPSSSWFITSSGSEGCSRVLVVFWFDIYFIGIVRDCFWEWMLSCCMRIWLSLKSRWWKKIRGLCQCQLKDHRSFDVRSFCFDVLNVSAFILQLLLRLCLLLSSFFNFTQFFLIEHIKFRPNARG